MRGAAWALFGSVGAGGIAAFLYCAWLGVALVLWALCFLVLNLTDKASDREHIRNALERHDNFRLYDWLLDTTLTRVGRLMAPSTAEYEPKPDQGWFAKLLWYSIPRARSEAEVENFTPWDWPVMDAALKLAVIYPLLLLLFQWGWTGEEVVSQFEIRGR